MIAADDVIVPLDNCPKCKGSGHLKDGRDCLCILLYNYDDDYRMRILTYYVQSVTGLKKELQQQGVNHPMVQGAAKVITALKQLQDGTFKIPKI